MSPRGVAFQVLARGLSLGETRKRRRMALVQESLAAGGKEVVEVPAWSPDWSSHVTWEPRGGG